MTTLDTLSDEVIAGWSEDASEPAWLRDRRLEAAKRYLDQAWPDSRQDEYWRSTPFAKRVPVNLPVIDSAAADTTLPVGLADALDGSVVEVRVLDGDVVDVSLPLALVDAGLVVTSLAEAAVEHEAVVREHLGSLTTTNRDGTGADDDRTITANDAAWTAGVFVQVPADLEIDVPIVIHLHVTVPGSHLPRILAVAGRHSRSALYVQHTSDGIDDKTLVDEIVEVVVLDGAHFDLVTLNEFENTVTHLSLQKAAVHRDATYRHLSVNTGGSTLRLRPEVDLVGPGASCFPVGVYFADEGQWFDLQPYIRHLAPHATSDVLFKGALQGRSRTVFRGNVLVAANAAGTDTNENNRTLILTPGARADSTPFLEINCADIRAGHGSATGQIDFQQLFYLEARGIPRYEALRLIVLGFFQEVFDRLDLPGIQEHAMATIEQEIDVIDLESVAIADVVPLGEDA